MEMATLWTLKETSWPDHPQPVTPPPFPLAGESPDLTACVRLHQATQMLLHCALLVAPAEKDSTHLSSQGNRFEEEINLGNCVSVLAASSKISKKGLSTSVTWRFVVPSTSLSLCGTHLKASASSRRVTKPSKNIPEESQPKVSHVRGKTPHAAIRVPCPFVKTRHCDCCSLIAR